MTTRVLHILGIDDSNTVTVLRAAPVLHPEDLSFLGNVEVLNLLDSPRLTVHTVIVGGMPGVELEIPVPDVVFSAICDPDTNSAALEVAEEIGKSLGAPVVNSPSAVRATTRDQVAERLRSLQGMVVPRTQRFTPRSPGDVAELFDEGAVGAPLLLRPAGAHGGEGLLRVDGAQHLDALDAFALDGRPYYATQFLDYASADGLYRKRRVIMVDGHPYPRHQITSDTWNVHSESRARRMAHDPALRDEEARFLEEFDSTAWPALAEIHERLGLDYFGVDFGMPAEGPPVLFEVNACARVLARDSDVADPHHHIAVEAIRNAFVELLVSRADGGA